MRWSRVFFNVSLLTLSFLATTTISHNVKDTERRQVASSDFYERALQGLVLQRRMFLDGFGNGTAALESLGYNDDDDDDEEDEKSKTTGGEEGRGRRKKLRQMNRTLMAMVMAFSLKFMFLVPSFIGTLILLKFATALAGFFYALFAAILGLDHHHHSH